jgi:hypothetical protein
MKIEMVEEKCYSFKVGDVQIEGMRKVSTWNGMTELRSPEGQALIVCFETGMSAELRGLLDPLVKRSVTIVSGSPDLIASIKAAMQPVNKVTVQVDMQKSTPTAVAAQISANVRRAQKRNA